MCSIKNLSFKKIILRARKKTVIIIKDKTIILKILCPILKIGNKRFYFTIICALSKNFHMLYVTTCTRNAFEKLDNSCCALLELTDRDNMGKRPCYMGNQMAQITSTRNYSAGCYCRRFFIYIILKCTIASKLEKYRYFFLYMENNPRIIRYSNCIKLV